MLCMVVAISSVIAAVVSVFGTIAGAMVAQRYALNNKSLELEAQQIEAREQRKANTADRVATELRESIAEKRRLYAELNSTARSHRSACEDLTKSLIPDDQLKVAKLDGSLVGRVEETRREYRILFARAQMVMADDTLEVVIEANRCLADAYSAVKRWVRVQRANPDEARSVSGLRSLEEIDAFLEGPCADAMKVLRRALRVELEVSDGSRDFSAELTTLDAARTKVRWGRSVD